MTSLPEFDPTLDDEALVRAGSERLGLSMTLEGRLQPVRHEFTHYTFVMHPRLARALAGTIAAETSSLEWLDPVDIENAALPAPILRLLRTLPSQALFT